CMQSIEFPFTF
nr:immunoglobulin light chain junction region [Macaca mulatta]MOV34060.1 immunoglobulin light chain junction region [Macaca mulatta]MOV34078.1 immunoglobulin light chain junction region [Macaca mulatta]MOV34081.1 immunoglobulin light chain junction region [Macaca mulatta]MOV34088.1 immunoglobulin light chain junction region [Macaca mulatta]